VRPFSVGPFNGEHHGGPCGPVTACVTECVSARSAESGVVITLAGTQSPHNGITLIRR